MDGNQRIIIFSCGCNCEKYAELNISSIKNQDYFNYVHVVVDDASTDKTYKRVKKLSHRHMRYCRNEDNQKWISNAIDYLDVFIESPDDIIVTVDLDDWLAHNNVLKNINKFYQENDTWITYSTFKYLKSGRMSSWIPKYTTEIMQNNSFRESIWSFTHLRTMKAFLWENINENDLKDINGNYFKYTYDQAVFLPALEMSRNGHIGYIPEFQYVYNDDNPEQVEKTHRQEQEDNAKYIRSLKKYEPLVRNK